MAFVYWPDGSTGVNPPRVSSEFGWRIHPITGIRTLHAGIDLVGWSTIHSPVTGEVTFAGYNGGAGNEVRIREDGTGDVFRLMHNREMWVRKGQRVTAGEGVAVMGTTGASTGVHCHEETRPRGGEAINPRDYYRARNSGSAAGGGSTPVIDYALLRRQKENGMYVRGATVKNVVYNVYTDVKGRMRVRVCGEAEAAYAFAGGLVVLGDDQTLTLLGRDGLYNVPNNSVMENVWTDTKVQRSVDGKVVGISALQELADAKTNTMALLARSGVNLTEEQIESIANSLVEAGVGLTPEEAEAATERALAKMTLKPSIAR